MSLTLDPARQELRLRLLGGLDLERKQRLTAQERHRLAFTARRNRPRDALTVRVAARRKQSRA